MQENVKPVFPMDIHDARQILIEICQEPQNSDIRDILERSASRFQCIGSNEWHGEMEYTWMMIVDVPKDLYARIRLSVDRCESKLSEIAGHLTRGHLNHTISNVRFQPVNRLSTAGGNEEIHPKMMAWMPDRFRMFISHNSTHTQSVERLKEEIERYGITVFVAKPSLSERKPWEDQLRLHLNSMNLLVAYLTEDFRTNSYTDHEAGWALGRQIPVLPLMLAGCKPPHGFLTSIQAITNCFEDRPQETAREISRVLIKDDRTQIEVRRTLMLGLQDCRDREHVDLILAAFGKDPELSEEEKQLLQKAADHGAESAKAIRTSDIGYRMIERTRAKPDDDMPF